MSRNCMCVKTLSKALSSYLWKRGRIWYAGKKSAVGLLGKRVGFLDLDRN